MTNTRKDTSNQTNLEASPILFDTPNAWFEKLYEDIENAKFLIYIEIYRLNNDEIGKKVVKLLSEKCKQGLEVKLLLDSWGTKQDDAFFSPITQNNGEVRFFNKLKLSLQLISKNHQRNHRKIIIIDNKILHFGSANITAYSKNWRESILRLEDSITLTFKKILLENWHIASLEFYKKRKYLKTIKVDGYEIIRDIPSIYSQKIKKHFEAEIKKAKKSIQIITPYFLPGYKLRRLLVMAAKKGVDVSIFIPIHSDVQLVDYLRDKYLGFYHERNVKLFLFQKTNLHAKIMLVDGKIFSLGSSNFDYRSFRYMHEINLSGVNSNIVSLLENFIEELKKDSIPFNYEKWKNRSTLHKIFGWLITPFRHYL